MFTNIVRPISYNAAGTERWLIIIIIVLKNTIKLDFGKLFYKNLKNPVELSSDFIVTWSMHLLKSVNLLLSVFILSRTTKTGWPAQSPTHTHEA